MKLSRRNLLAGVAALPFIGRAPTLHVTQGTDPILQPLPPLQSCQGRWQVFSYTQMLPANFTISKQTMDALDLGR